MNILTRPATESDYSTINKMLLELQNYHVENVPTIYKKVDYFLTQDEYIKILKDKNIIFFLAILDKEIVGLIWLRFIKKDNKYEYKRTQVWVEGIYVEPSKRRKGVGQILLNEAINKAKILEAKSLDLMIWDFNKISKNFFEKYLKKRAIIMSINI